ncbi:hypothetical protein LZ009_21785 [Ramlibacter sp. XY19]|uniref:WapI family immunity protein n=1 Tax=Ramlibacter paludis TaxID=2908000 RepID=UPI0023D9D255|nr:hypothetical protein [Ramlibacter paludis]MCG2595419.1 hypothetical protein [Ramlibacter paludis]
MEAIRFGTNSEYVAITVPRAIVLDGYGQIGVEISVDGFKGAVAAFVEKDDLNGFLRQLQKVQATLLGTAELKPRDEQFVLKLAPDRLGHICVEGIAWSHPTHGNRLSFELEIDQTFLAEPIRQLRAALAQEGGHDA